MHLQQRTLGKAVSLKGVGVHSGKTVRMTLLPAPLNHGIQFARKDLPGSPGIPARFNRVVDTSLATVIGSEGVIVSTIEHLMASFSGLSIDNALVELDSYEIPIMDGSAYPFTRLIRQAGIRVQPGPKCFFVVKKPICLAEGEKSVTALPDSGFKITCTIEFPHPLIGKQTYFYEGSAEQFEQDICRARTFGFFHEVEYMKRFGLARGGSLENAIVLDKDRVLNPGGLRFKDEFVRHKILDCLGDFSLLGIPILGHLVVARSGHKFNHLFLKEFFSKKTCWETLTVHDIGDFKSRSPEALAV